MHTARQNHKTFGNNFSKFSKKVFLILFDKTHESMVLIMGKRLRLCHFYVVTQIQSTGKHQDLEQPVILSNLHGVSQKKA